MYDNNAQIIDIHEPCIKSAANRCPPRAIVIKDETTASRPRKEVARQPIISVMGGGTGMGNNSSGRKGRRGRASRPSGGGRGTGGGNALGPGGICFCPHCGYSEPHNTGNPCYRQRCPECGTTLTRKIS